MVYMYHIFILSFINGHLGSFHVLAIVLLFIIIFFSKKTKLNQKRDVPLEFSKEETDVLPHWVTSGQ